MSAHYTDQAYRTQLSKIPSLQGKVHFLASKAMYTKEEVCEILDVTKKRLADASRRLREQDIYLVTVDDDENGKLYVTDFRRWAGIKYQRTKAKLAYLPREVRLALARSEFYSRSVRHIQGKIIKLKARPTNNAMGGVSQEDQEADLARLIDELKNDLISWEQYERQYADYVIKGW